MIKNTKYRLHINSDGYNISKLLNIFTHHSDAWHTTSQERQRQIIKDGAATSIILSLLARQAPVDRLKTTFFIPGWQCCASSRKLVVLLTPSEQAICGSQLCLRLIFDNDNNMFTIKYP